MKYFTIQELTRSATATRMHIDNTPDRDTVRCLELLVNNILDPLRARYGRPIYVTSGYRCRRLNDAVGGAYNSQHILGQAADITVGSPEDNRQLYSLIRQMRLPFDQLIDEHDMQWIHVSYGPRHRRQAFAIKR